MRARPPLLLDFQRQPGRRGWLGAAVLLLGIGLSGIELMHYRRIDIDRLAWEEQMARLERASQRRHPVRLDAGRDTDTQSLRRELQQANEVLARLAWPWDGFFQAVEASATDQVALLAMRPDIAKRSVAITGEARDLNAMLDYLRHLEKQGMFARVTLHGHEIQLQDRDRPVRFSLTAALRAPS